LNFNEGDTRKLERLTILLLIAMLAQFVLYLFGLAVKLMNKHRCYQANSVKNEAVLSYQFIGLRAFKDRRFSVTSSDWERTYLKLQQLMREVTAVDEGGISCVILWGSLRDATLFIWHSMGLIMFVLMREFML